MKPPTPKQIRLARQAAGLTQSQAALLVYATDPDKPIPKTWQNWEAEPGSKEHRSMHPAIYELFLLKTQQIKLKDIT